MFVFFQRKKNEKWISRRKITESFELRLKQNGCITGGVKNPDEFGWIGDKSSWKEEKDQKEFLPHIQGGSNWRFTPSQQLTERWDRDGRIWRWWVEGWEERRRQGGFGLHGYFPALETSSRLLSALLAVSQQKNSINTLGGREAAMAPSMTRDVTPGDYGAARLGR